MSSGKKFILIVIDIFLLTLVIPTVWDYYTILEYGENFTASSQISYIGEYVPLYLFWGNAILGAVLLLALLIIAVYPRTYVDISLPAHGGKLTVKRSAIEGLVREKVQENDYLKLPRINTVLHKNKISINVKGEIIPRVEVAAKAQQLEQEISESLKNFFGVDQPMKIKVEVETINKEAKTEHARVV